MAVIVPVSAFGIIFYLFSEHATVSLVPPEGNYAQAPIKGQAFMMITKIDSHGVNWDSFEPVDGAILQRHAELQSAIEAADVRSKYAGNPYEPTISINIPLSVRQSGVSDSELHFEIVSVKANTNAKG